MPNPDRWTTRAGLFLAAFALAAGLIQLARVSYARGGVYPEYSSLRADPSGAKVFFEALERTGVVEVARKYRPLSEAPEKSATIFFLGVSPVSLLFENDEYFASLRRAAEAGNRIVLGLSGSSRFVPELKTKSALERQWGIHLSPVKKSDEDQWPAYFDAYAGWSTISAREGRRVIVERAFGAGSVVLLASSYPFGNRAMVEDREPSLLLRVMGANGRAVFDESHFGVTETGSILGLARKYRLQGLLWGLAILAAAFIWKSSVPFPPVSGGAAAKHVVAGRDAHSGFVRLLRRHIPPANLIETCLLEWKGPRPRSAETPRDPVRAYREIQSELNPKRSTI